MRSHRSLTSFGRGCFLRSPLTSYLSPLTCSLFPSRMFIELTDHLRCPQDHEESFLVLLPDKMEGRSVVAGQLGCPVCGRTYEVKAGAVNFGGAPEESDQGDTVLDAAAVNALAGLSGPGGYLTL